MTGACTTLAARAIAELGLGWRTDLIFPRFDAEVIARPDHLLIRTAHNPGFYWGNFLLYPRAPREGDAAAWLAAFDDGIASLQPESRHLAFGIDTGEPFTLPHDFAAAGIDAYASTVLTLRRDQLCAPRRGHVEGLRVRALHWPDDVPAAVECQVKSDAGDHEPQGFRRFRERQMQRYGRMAAQRLGDWFGVFAASAHGERLVADCGLFRDGFGPHALGRFQHVQTDPAWRRQGVCSALVHSVCRYGFDVMKLETLVIVADPSDVAIGLYESLGFQRGTSNWHLERRPPQDRRGAMAFRAEAPS